MGYSFLLCVMVFCFVWICFHPQHFLLFTLVVLLRLEGVLVPRPGIEPALVGHEIAES